jgi:hypothetical protein
MKVLKKHLKYLKSANIYPNGIVFFFEKHDKETNISFDYRIKLSKNIGFYDRHKDDNPICDRLHFYFYSYEKPVNPLQLCNINHVSIYSDNASIRQKEKGITNEYVKAIFADSTFLVSQKYRINDDLNLHCIDHFSFSYYGNSQKQFDDYTAIHTITIESDK